MTTATLAPRRLWSIRLSGEQRKFAKKVTDRIRAKCRGKRDGHGGNALTIGNEFHGYCGELAAALLLGVEWTGGAEDATAAGSDIGRQTQVRTLVHGTSHRLLVRPHDLHKYGNVPFVLVRREADGDTYTLLGWCYAFEVPLRGKLTDGGDPSRPPCYLVHPAALRPIDTLPQAEV